MTIINQRELRVFGLERSGIHAIVNWILQQASGPCLFLNNIKRLVGNPYADARNYHQIHVGRRHFSKEQEAGGHHKPKTLLVLGYEDKDLRAVPIGFQELLQEYVGHSRSWANVIIIRDPYNFFASRMAYGERGKNPIRLNKTKVVCLWKQYAKECLGETAYLGRKKTVISFNRWFRDDAYRSDVAKRLGLTFTDAGLQTVPHFGDGSSFDKCSYDGNAQAMQVLDRWKLYEADPFYRSLFADAEMDALAKRLFGVNPAGPLALHS